MKKLSSFILKYLSVILNIIPILIVIILNAKELSDFTVFAIILILLALILLFCRKFQKETLNIIITLLLVLFSIGLLLLSNILPDLVKPYGEINTNNYISNKMAFNLLFISSVVIPSLNITIDAYRYLKEKDTKTKNE